MRTTLTTSTSRRHSGRQKNSIFIMSVTTSAPDRSIWTLEDETQLVHYLTSRKLSGPVLLRNCQRMLLRVRQKPQRHVRASGIGYVLSIFFSFVLMTWTLHRSSDHIEQ